MFLDLGTAYVGVCTVGKCTELYIYDVCTFRSLVFQYEVFVSQFLFCKCELLTYPRNLPQHLFAAMDKLMCTSLIYNGEVRAKFTESGQVVLLRVLLHFWGCGPIGNLIKIIVKRIIFKAYTFCIRNCIHALYTRSDRENAGPSM